MKLDRFILVLLIVLLINDFIVLAENIAVAYIISILIDNISNVLKSEEN